jgi:hypothetical protein
MEYQIFNQFREDDIVIMTHFDKREEKRVRTVYVLCNLAGFKVLARNCATSAHRFNTRY